MSAVTDALIAGLQALETVTGNKTITWRGNSLKVTPSGLTRQENLEPGGIEPAETIQFTVREAAIPVVANITGITADTDKVTADSTEWTADSGSSTWSRLLPSAGDQVIYSTTTYRVSETTRVPDSHIVLRCVELNG